MKLRTQTCAFVSMAALLACQGQEDSAVLEDVADVSTPLSLSEVRRLADLDVKYTVIENVPAECPSNAPWGLCLDAKISLTNHGRSIAAGGGWSIYFSSIRKVLAVDSAEFVSTHINGDLHKLEPTAAFSGFGRGETKEIPFQAEYWMMSESDVMPRFYVAAPGSEPQLLEATDTENLADFVEPFVTPEQTRRHPADQSVIATAGTRFSENSALSDLGPDAVAAEIVPRPMTLTLGSGTLDLSNGVRFGATDLDAAALDVIKASLRRLGVDVGGRRGTRIDVVVDAGDAAFAGKPTAEAYGLSIGAESVRVVGGDAAGAFYGLQSLIGLLPADRSGRLPELEIPYDAPRYGYRGVQLDLARNFHGVSSIMRVLDQMAAYKLSTLHLHLSDDEGWRLQIPGLPELTDVGARRCHDLADGECLLPQLGSGPDATSSGTGHLSRADFVGILRAARARQIEVIPEFDMPGHARAAIKAMEARARNGDSSYLLSDPDDASQYLSIQRYTDNAINACMESSYVFLEKVMDEVKSMYSEAGAPLETWHVGGDEVGAGAWTASPACEALYAQGQVQDANDVHAYFVRRANALAAERNIGIRGWSDGLRKTVRDAEGNLSKVFLDPSSDLDGNPVTTNWWGTLFWWDNSAYTLANMGYGVILTSPDFLYLDHPYEADPKERGYYWATRFTNVKKLFSYISGNLPANSQLTKDRMGGDYTGAFAGVVELTQPQNVIGMEAPLWSETVRTAEQLDSMVFPRLLAFAERAWHRAAWEPVDGNDHDAAIDTAALAADWERFANTLGHKELPKLDRSAVRYRVEVPGARIVEGQLQANVAAPGLGLQYKKANGKWASYDAANPPSVTSTEVRAVTSMGRAGRSVPVQ
jgi:hexosaminidase